MGQEGADTDDENNGSPVLLSLASAVIIVRLIVRVCEDTKKFK